MTEANRRRIDTLASQPFGVEYRFTLEGGVREGGDE